MYEGSDVLKNLDSYAMSKAVKEVITLCGIDVLSDANRFQAAIRDFLHSSSLTTEQQLLVFSVRIGIGGKLLKAVNNSVSEQKRMLIVADALLTLEYGFLKSRSHSILSVFMSALGWQQISLPKDTRLPQDRKQQSATINLSRENNATFVKGAVIPFGKYMWRVLYVRGNTALLIADEITDIGIPYDNAVNLDGVTWETCSLRKWLNTEFLERFSKEQRNKIIKKRITPENSHWYQTDAGNQTEDEVFLLSVSEIIRNFGDSGHIKIRPENSWTYDTAPDGLSYAIDDGYNAARQATYKGETTWWWLRSPGDSKTKVAYVNADGIIFLNGESAFDDGGTSCVGVRPGVRPVIWLRQ